MLAQPPAVADGGQVPEAGAVDPALADTEAVPTAGRDTPYVVAPFRFSCELGAVGPTQFLPRGLLFRKRLTALQRLTIEHGSENRVRWLNTVMGDAGRKRRMLKAREYFRGRSD